MCYMKYYRIEDNFDLENRWYLDAFTDGKGIELDGREFTYGRSIDTGPPLKMGTWKDERIIETQSPLRLSLYRKRTGAPLDFTFTGENVPVVTSRVANILTTHAKADIQRIPVHVEGQKESYEIINVTSLIDCIDTQRSEIRWFEKDNDIRPDLAGEPEWVRKLVIDPHRVGQHHMLRLKGWELPIIVSEPVKEMLENAKVSGIWFTKVSL